MLYTELGVSRGSSMRHNINRSLQALAEWEREAAELKADGTKLNFDGGCIDHDAKLGDPAAIDKKVDGTEKTNGRDALELAERMSKLNLTSVV